MDPAAYFTFFPLELSASFVSIPLFFSEAPWFGDRLPVFVFFISLGRITRVPHRGDATSLHAQRPRKAENPTPARPPLESFFSGSNSGHPVLPPFFSSSPSTLASASRRQPRGCAAGCLDETPSFLLCFFRLNSRGTAATSRAADSFRIFSFFLSVFSSAVDNPRSSPPRCIYISALPWIIRRPGRVG